MRKILIFILVISFAFSTACGNTAGQAPTGTQVSAACANPADDEAAAALSDWILGTDYGIVSGNIDTSQKCVRLTIPTDRLESLTQQDKQDMYTAITDILSLHFSQADAEGYSIQYQTGTTADGPGQPSGDAAQNTVQPNKPAVSYMGEGPAITNLIFIHHSCGANWLNDGLCKALNDNGYHVADITYGWREYGDNTDTSDWPNWFTDDVMNLVYNDMDVMDAPNNIEPAAGENKIVMFKSCFPNSDVGSDITDEKAIYYSLLPYFERHPDKMFVLITPPPMINISYPVKTRELCNWLYDRKTGWLSGLTTGNVFVFDFYNVLTHPDAHHRFVDKGEAHESVPGKDTLYYGSNGDDHPNKDGNVKATQDFIGLLNSWYKSFSESRD